MEKVTQKSFKLKKFLTKKHAVILIFSGVIFFTALIFLPSTIVNKLTASLRYDIDTHGIENIPKNRVAIVFGAGSNPDFTPSPYLQDRLDIAIQLYKAGRVEKLLMSGDNGVDHYNEPVSMKKYALKNGVPDGDVYMDYAGFSTYETCYRAQAIFGLREATLVTHGYHLPRAIFTCNRLGVKSIGVATHWATEKFVQTTNYEKRELLSTNKAMFELFISKPKPTFLGDKIVIE